MKYEFEVIGKINGKARPRLNMYTGKVYTPTNTKDYENLIREYIKIKYHRNEILKGRIKVTIVAYFAVPKSTSTKDRENMLLGNISPTKQPDIDNIVKIVLDALNKYVFEDDNQITKLDVEKVYAEEEKVYVAIEEY